MSIFFIYYFIFYNLKKLSIYLYLSKIIIFKINYKYVIQLTKLKIFTKIEITTKASLTLHLILTFMMKHNIDAFFWNHIYSSQHSNLS